MNKKLRIQKSIAAFLLIAMLLSCFAACNDGKTPQDGTTESTDITTEADTAETEPETGDEPVSDVLVWAKSRKTDFVITYNTRDSESIIQAANNMISKFSSATRAKIDAKAEQDYGKDEVLPTYEIIVGNSTREEFADFYAGLQYKEYAIEVRGTKVLIAGFDDLSLLDALDYFYSNLLNADNQSIATNYSYHWKPTYTAQSILLDGKDISEWRVVYSTVMGNSAQRVKAVEDLRAYIGEAYGKMPTVEKYKASSDLKGCIVVGGHKDRPINVAKYGDCKVSAENGTIYVDANDIVGLETGVAYVASQLLAGESVSVQSSAFSYESTLPDRSTYLNDPTKFNTCFDLAFQLPAEQLTLEWRVKQLNDPTAGTLLMAHRSFHTYYPEESLEALIAAWRLGCVATEYDLHITKDGIPVAIHDDKLNRVTNVDAMQKQDPTLPTSDNVADWTYEQLLQLRMLDDYGDVTPFQISTLEEGLKACDGRILFFYEFKTGNASTYLWPTAERLGIYDCIFSSTSSISSSSSIRNKYASKGAVLQTLTRSGSTSKTADMLVSLSTYGPDVLTPLLVPLGDYQKWGSGDVAVIQPYLDKVRIGAWVLREYDYPYIWHETQQKGISVLFTDDPLPIMRHLRATASK